MKKLLFVTCCLLSAFLLISCSSPQKQQDSKQSSETATEKNKKSRDLTTKTFNSLTFQFPKDCDYTADSNSAVISLQSTDEVITITSVDISQLSSDMISVWEATAISNLISQFDTVQNKEEFTVKISGVSANAATATINQNGTTVTCNIVAFVNPNQKYAYYILYGVKQNTETDMSEYQDFSTSITFTE